ncbi:MAG: copper amine oxidase N-terminal domain-containing protein [Clostridia bacterium]|nr:copper amine oxidase N-terminal domain-containing protein [Clostridia bacterium]
MKKKIALICAAVMLVAFVAQPVGAVNVIMNSAFLKFPDQEPVVVDGTTLVPLRAVVEALGLEVTWDDPTDTVVVKKDNFYIELVIGSTKAKTAGGVKSIPQAPVIINGRTMVPLRFIAEEMGLTVLWNQEYQRVIINGQVDTQTVVKVPVEEVTDVEAATDTEEAEVKEGEKSEEIVEEETEFIEEITYTTIESPAAVILLNIPNTYEMEDTDSEESFAYRSLDAFDAQHTYNWEIVSQYESYADKDSGILFVVQEQTYEGEEYDVSVLKAEYPTPPEQPERPEYPDAPEEVKMVEDERDRLALESLYTDAGLEFPQEEELNMERLMEDLGYADGWELYNVLMEAVENVDMTQIEGYDIWQEYQDETQAIRDAYNEERKLYNEEKKIYDEECAYINKGKDYVFRNYQALYSSMPDDEWIEFISSRLNTDEEVRYESVEVLDVDGKKVIHAVIYAEDPDDEQGTYEYYHYQEGDALVTIFGGTLYSGETHPEIIDILSGMIIN